MKSPAIAFVGRHNSGKTTLICALIAELTARGIDVGSIKHHGHVGFEIDQVGKDSWRHREAGSSEVVVASPDKLALIRRLADEANVCDIIELMEPHDVVIVEGYRRGGLPYIEIMRHDNERDCIAAAEFVKSIESGRGLHFDEIALGSDADRMPDEWACGVASDIPEVLKCAKEAGLRAFSLDNMCAIADFIQKEYLS